MPRDKVLATVVRLLERTLIRVGNDEYARTNNSYGLTTLRNRHVDVKGDVVRFSFRGKHGIKHEVEVEDPRVAQVLRSCLDLPGQELFEYVDEDGEVRDVGSSDVNEYLKDIAGEDFTAKDFRTWYATSAALEALAGTAVPHRARSEGDAEAGAAVGRGHGSATRLTMCRKCYVNPVVIDAFLAGELREVALRGGGDGRVRLLQLLTRTPARRRVQARAERRASTDRREREIHAPPAPTIEREVDRHGR